MRDSAGHCTFVLLGIIGSGKSSTGNSLLGGKAYDVGHTAASCTEDPQSAPGKITFQQESMDTVVEVPVLVIDAPGYGDSRGKDQDKLNINRLVNYLEKEVMFVNSFLLVVNGASPRFDGQMFEMLQVSESLPS
jgi:predicted GTPase